MWMPLNQPKAETRVLRAYLLGSLDYADLLRFQRRLVFDVSGDRSTGVLLLTEHPTCISMGREGSTGHILSDAEDGNACPVHWVNRGGGCLLHAPGQVVGYSILALDELKIDIQKYLDRLHVLLRDVIASFFINAEIRSPQSGIWVGDRRIAHVGIAVRDWVAYFGFAINVDPELKMFRRVQCDGEARAMTSLERECRVRCRPTTVRQRLLEAYAERFDFSRVSLFHHHPSLPGKATHHAVAASAC